MKPHRRNKKDSKKKDSGSSTTTTKRKDNTPATLINPILDTKPEQHKDIFLDIEPDSRTGLLVKDLAEDKIQQVEKKQNETTTVQLPEESKLKTDEIFTTPSESQPLISSVSIDMNQQPIEVINIGDTSSEEDSESFDPSHFSDTLTLLNTANGSDVYLIGTAHFSTKSVQDVEKVIRSIRPSAVVLELCHERSFMLKLDEQSLIQQNKNLSMEKVLETMSEKGFAQGLIYIMFIKMSASITEKLGMAPGSEFRAGSREALNIPGCNIILGDRSLKITIARAVASISMWQKMKLIYQFIKNDVNITQDDVEKCKDKDMLEQLMKELAGEFPGFKQVLLDERNIFLAHSIYRYAQNSETSMGPQKIVAIVGIGHVAGIIEHWGKTTDEQIMSLQEMPKKSKTGMVVKKTIKYCSIIALVYFGYRVCVPSSIQDSIASKLMNWRG